MKIIILLVLLAIFISLANAVFHLLKGNSTQKMLRSLMWRVALSIFLLCLLGIASYLGYINPNQPKFLN